MSDRLISADELRKNVLYLPNCYNGFSDTYDKAMIIDLIDEQPPVDAVEVVHCKDCVCSYPFDEEDMKYPYRVGEWYCEYWYAEMHADDYCSCGKRRKQDEVD